MKNAYIIDGTRSAIGNFKGQLAAVRTDDLMASVLKNLMTSSVYSGFTLRVATNAIGLI